ncbi:copper resistance protein CopC [Paracoccus sp. S3-43]|uniref:copper resistance CopC/CopD family protein n=1 Tax=Paracoccus sp. S3-43 TaxID=3030011 RepID=UPI0023AF2286|nr:copper resistance protein CopC [Paracoccus sp. S3-43]WEF24847.1 copper resistance protein CopC [Paracoccus sp. S3-43]
MTRPFRLQILALVQILLLTMAGAVHAHAVLQSTAPADNALLGTAPESASLTFNEAVAPLAIRLIAPDGTESDLTDRVPGAQELVIPLPPLGQGTHVLSWRVASDDGHPIAGALVFSVGVVTGAAAAAPQGDPAVRAAIWLARFAMTSGLVLGVGGALFGAVAGLSGKARRPVGLAAWAGFVAAPAYLGLHGLDALGLGLGALFTAAPWAAAWGTSFGPSVALAMAAAALALLSLRFRGLAWIALALLAASHAASGHAGTAQPRWMTRPMVFLHLAALCFWIGALIPLALSLREGAAGLRRFSAAIPFAVILLLGSGLALAVVQLGRDPAQWLTPYGFILAAKLTLLAAIFALAGFNRWTLTAPALAGDGAAGKAMRRSIAAELLLALAILGLTAGWRFTPPPRALAQAHAAMPAAYGHLHSDQAMANLIVTPGAAGPVSVEIQVTDGDMAPLQPLAVTLSLSMPERGIEPMTRPAAARKGDEGVWLVPDLVLPLPGTWTVEVEIRLSRFQMATLGGTLDID